MHNSIKKNKIFRNKLSQGSTHWKLKKTDKTKKTDTIKKIPHSQIERLNFVLFELYIIMSSKLFLNDLKSFGIKNIILPVLYIVYKVLFKLTSQIVIFSFCVAVFSIIYKSLKYI